MNINTVITIEECEACSNAQEFTVEDLYIYDLYRNTITEDNTSTSTTKASGVAYVGTKTSH